MQIGCKPIPSVGNKTFVNPDDSILSEYGDYEKNQTWDGRETNSFLVGMESQHDNSKEDRKYRFYYRNSENWGLFDCEYSAVGSGKESNEARSPLKPI